MANVVAGLSGARPRSVANPLKRVSTDPVADTVALVKTYVRQETIEPLKGLQKFVLWGVVGAVALGLGTLLALLALLRFLQGYMHGSMSWLPYLLSLIAGLLVIGLAAWRIGAGKSSEQR